MKTATFNATRTCRFTLERTVTLDHIGACRTIGYLGVNPSKAGVHEEDHTTTKLAEFTRRANACRYLLANAFPWIATDVRQLPGIMANYADDGAYGLNSTIDWLGNHRAIDDVIAQADVLVPMWGSRTKLPKILHPHLDALQQRLFESGKPVFVFGLTKDGDPMHPLMLSYALRLRAWIEGAKARAHQLMPNDPPDPEAMRALRDGPVMPMPLLYEATPDMFGTVA